MVRPSPFKSEYPPWTCFLCQITTSSEVNLVAHLRGARHRQMQRSASGSDKELAARKARAYNREQKRKEQQQQEEQDDGAAAAAEEDMMPEEPVSEVVRLFMAPLQMLLPQAEAPVSPAAAGHDVVAATMSPVFGAEYLSRAAPWTCHACNRQFKENRHMTQHASSAKHRAKVLEVQEAFDRSIGAAARAAGHITEEEEGELPVDDEPVEVLPSEPGAPHPPGPLLPLPSDLVESNAELLTTPASAARLLAEELEDGEIPLDVLVRKQLDEEPPRHRRSRSTSQGPCQPCAPSLPCCPVLPLERAHPWRLLWCRGSASRHGGRADGQHDAGPQEGGTPEAHTTATTSAAGVRGWRRRADPAVRGGGWSGRSTEARGFGADQVPQEDPQVRACRWLPLIAMVGFQPADGRPAIEDRPECHPSFNGLCRVPEAAADVPSVGVETDLPPTTEESQVPETEAATATEAVELPTEGVVPVADLPPPLLPTANKEQAADVPASDGTQLGGSAEKVKRRGCRGSGKSKRQVAHTADESGQEGAVTEAEAAPAPAPAPPPLEPLPGSSVTPTPPRQPFPLPPEGTPGHYATRLPSMHLPPPPAHLYPFGTPAGVPFGAPLGGSVGYAWTPPPPAGTPFSPMPPASTPYSPHPPGSLAQGHTPPFSMGYRTPEGGFSTVDQTPFWQPQHRPPPLAAPAGLPPEAASGEMVYSPTAQQLGYVDTSGTFVPSEPGEGSRAAAPRSSPWVTWLDRAPIHVQETEMKLTHSSSSSSSSSNSQRSGPTSNSGTKRSMGSTTSLATLHRMPTSLWARPTRLSSPIGSSRRLRRWDRRPQSPDRHCGRLRRRSRPCS